MAESDKKESRNNKGKPQRLVRFGDLNMLGKAVFIGGAITRVATKAVDSAIKASADIVVEAEKAFKQGLDPNIEDAKILDESEEKRKKK